MTLGLFGKLPLRGDFVTRALPAPMLAPWEAWLDAVTDGSREVLGAEWERAWDAAPVWRFWIGAWVPGGPAAGAVRPSRDSVGRRYPLLILWSGGPDEAPPPPVQPDAATAAWYDSVAACLWRLTDRDGAEEPVAAMAGLPPPPLLPIPADPRGAFFAEAGAGLAALIADVAPHDHAIAALRRTYWWSGTGAETAMLAQEGMPDAGGFAALLSALAPGAAPVLTPVHMPAPENPAPDDPAPDDPAAAWRRPGAAADADPDAAWHVGASPSGRAPPHEALAVSLDDAAAAAPQPLPGSPRAADDHSPFGSADESPFGQAAPSPRPAAPLSSVFRRRH